MADLVKKDIKYLSKDFGEFRQNLINFTKNYFPDTYNDFNESSPGMMFMEMASYVGDVLAYYTDSNLKESMLSFAEERGNINAIATGLGFKPKNMRSSLVTLDVYQTVPAIGTGVNARPDFKYALNLNAGMVAQSNTGVQFRTLNPVDFNFTGSGMNARNVSVYQVDETTGTPTYYLLKKQAQAVSGEIVTDEFVFEEPKIYDKIVLPFEDVIEIIDCHDEQNNRWYEVDYLAQEFVQDSIRNTPDIDPDLASFASSAPYILKLRRTAKRFITRFRADRRLELQFGAGISEEHDRDLVPNPENVGLGLKGFKREVDISVDPANFLYSSTYGQAPSQTTLTIRYTRGQGLTDNVPANTIQQITDVEYGSQITTVDATLLQQAKDSVAVNNPFPAKGGGNMEPIETIRQKSLSAFAAQNRAVTKEDYIMRAYTMPPKFGDVAKAYIIQDEQVDSTNPEAKIANPLAMNMYCMGYNSVKQLVPLNAAVKQNLKTYISQFRLMTDAINIKDAFIINFGVEFEIIPKPSFNGSEVVLKCIDVLRDLLNVERMQINAPIIISDIFTRLDSVEGVQTVSEVEIINLFDSNSGYSGNVYDIEAATLNNVIYPSLDPCIFEIKYPNKDIKGRIVGL
tara:strand:- start:9384 stop:11264 length:1881 start_codon:yes stop_codon:yes gene_type:complete